MTVSSTIPFFAATGCSVPFTATCTGSHLERSHPAYPLCHRSAGRSPVEHGDIRCLGPRCDKPAGHTFRTRWTV